MMVFEGGKLFVRRADESLPQVHIRNAVIVVDLPDNASVEDMMRFLDERCAGGSVLDGCRIITLERWAENKGKDAILRASSRSGLPGFAQRLIGIFGSRKS